MKKFRKLNIWLFLKEKIITENRKNTFKYSLFQGDILFKTFLLKDASTVVIAAFSRPIFIKNIWNLIKNNILKIFSTGKEKIIFKNIKIYLNLIVKTWQQFY